MSDKLRIEEYEHGRYKYKVEHHCEKLHSGFLHKIFCNVTEVETTTNNCDDYWWRKTVTHVCGYEKVIMRFKDGK